LKQNYTAAFKWVGVYYSVIVPLISTKQRSPLMLFPNWLIAAKTSSTKHLRKMCPAPGGGSRPEVGFTFWV